MLRPMSLADSCVAICLQTCAAKASDSANFEWFCQRQKLIKAGLEFFGPFCGDGKKYERIF